ncbi:MAG: hypothetical protein REI93_09780, partial [Pedobacter sp.]|nr:hypothetical protein [Pedobacter sp.]
NYDSFSFDLGLAKTVAFTGIGGTGYRSVRKVLRETNTNRAFGYLYAEKAKDQSNAVLDFIREQDNPVIPELPSLAMPVHTPDLFTYSGQTGSGQFRLYRGGTGMYFDNEATDISHVSSDGFDLGAGAYFHGGVTAFDQNSTSTSRKWRNENNYKNFGDFQDPSLGNPSREHLAFRLVGERIASDATADDRVHQNKPVSVVLDGSMATSALNAENQVYPIGQKIEKEKRTPTMTSVSYLTASEAAHAGRDPKINNYNFNSTSFVPAAGHQLTSTPIDRVSDYRKGHHISEISVTDPSGARSVYGLPVYNIKQDEYTFAIGTGYSKFDQNQVSFNTSAGKPDHKNKGIDDYYHKESQPAYASSYLLTQVLSADYIDRGERGITEDDAGTAVKFNYSKVAGNYKWRTPFASPNGSQNATLNKGLLADPDDDKASIVYGEKELWYLSSIESKTKIAYFITADRDDALGAYSWAGSTDYGVRQKRLVEIRLYSKNNIKKPIKVIKLCQKYALCPGTPNSSATSTDLCSAGGTNVVSKAKGKLTLDRVWFEYGNTTKGSNHPYVFSYNTQGYAGASSGSLTEIAYTPMSSDRWGNFKGSNQNGASAMGNDEFPYTPQDDANKMNKNAGLWNLSTIELPSGGKITVNYESDDYAYVQNRKAMQMVPFETFDTGSDTNLSGAKGIKVTIDATGAPSNPALQAQWFKQTYLNGADYLYTKMFVRMANDQNTGPANNDKDFVTTYCKIKNVSLSGNVATVIFEDVADGGVVDNPIRFAAWQNVKLSYPRYAFSGFQNRVNDNSLSSSISGLVRAISDAAKNLSELKENFYEKARRKGWCKEVDKTKSFLRLAKIDGKKFGGGSRVKQVRIEDKWQSMAGSTAVDGAYGQSYDYTTEIDGKTVSSGVATYEPSVGNDENPMKLPINYVQKIKGSLNNFFSLEQPFGESLFPAPSVGYSKVTVRDLNAAGVADPDQRTGYTVSEFYTAKEFPVRVVATPLTKNNLKKKSLYTLVKSDSREENILSQGYYVELNDMHGKGRSKLTYNAKDVLIASTRYHYNTEEVAPGEMRLKNEVKVIKNGQVSSAIIGRDLEFFTDFREQESSNVGTTYNIGIDIFPVIFIPFFPLPHAIPRKTNNEYKLFRSACAVKVAQYYAVLDKVEKMENGSNITTENMAYDADTGEPVVTRTQNEFDKYVYKVNFPAHWVYSGMAGAYQNVGALLKGLSMSGTGLNAPFSNFLEAGDELVNTANGKLLWVVEDESGQKRLVDKQGYVQETISANDVFKVIRSGHRNQLATSASSLTCLENPIVGNFLILEDSPSRSAKVLQAQAQNFDQNWYPEPWKIKMDTTLKEEPAHDVYVKKVLEDVHWETDGCNWYYVGKIKLKWYTIVGGVEQPCYHSFGVPVYFYYTDPDYFYEGYGGTYTSNGTGEALVTTNHMYNSEYSILFENDECPGAYTRDYLTSFYPGYNATVSSKFVATMSATYVNVITQQPVNPYVMGYKGNWRPKETRVVQANREDFSVLTSKGANVATAGYIKDFSFNWGYNSSAPYWSENYASGPWNIANKVTNYDRYGQEIENKNKSDYKYALDDLGQIDDGVQDYLAYGNFKAASFVFNGQLPEAVASNAMKREIYSNSFEDVNFRSNHFDDKKNNIDLKYANGTTSISGYINASVAHTGNYSLDLTSSGINLKTFAHNNAYETKPFVVLNAKKEFIINDDKYFWGFEPLPGKSYLFTVWVRDAGTTTNNHVDVDLLANGVPVTLKCTAVVEKWKKIEGTISLIGLTALQNLNLRLVPNVSNVKIDDIRIHPYNGHMKTYAYDDKNYRLMAELDENAFASFYEYDDEGILVRVKKETERGIVTLKETRSSFKKKQ